MLGQENSIVKMEVVEYFRRKYDYIEEYELEMMFDSAHEILLNLLYPFDFTKTEVPSNIFQRYKSWVRRAIQEMIDRNGMTSYTNYTENGISVRMDRTQLSQGLIDEITPFGRVI